MFPKEYYQKYNSEKNAKFNIVVLFGDNYYLSVWKLVSLKH